MIPARVPGCPRQEKPLVVGWVGPEPTTDGL